MSMKMVMVKTIIGMGMVTMTMMALTVKMATRMHMVGVKNGHDGGVSGNSDGDNGCNPPATL